MKRMTMVLVVLLSATFAYGADEMSKLGWMAGEWKGEASVQMGPGKPQMVLQTEKITPKAGGKVLIIEGLGRKKLEDGTAGEVVHDAIAMISWDATKKTYRFIGHVAQQESVDTTLDMTAPDTFVWGFDTPQGGKVRYTIRLTDKGQWNEIGEFTRDGTKWMKFFEMTLTKSK
jgi:hypothetical protein